MDKKSSLIDSGFLLEKLKELVLTPSPVSFYDFGNPLLERYAKEMELAYFEDERHTFYVEVPGRDNSRTVLVGAHMDTLGYMVRSITPEGTLKLKGLGGVQNHSLEHEQGVLYTRSLKAYTGMVTLVHHSTHVYEDAREMPRDIDNMRFMLDEDVACEADVLALGIRPGDIIAPETHFFAAENGRIRSRFIDNKGAAASVWAVLKALRENQLVPRYRTLFAFPYFEEVGAGGAYVPPEVREYVALDIGAIGEDNKGTERSVSIVAADKLAPYDRQLTGELAQRAETLGIPYSIELFPRYSTDGMRAFTTGNNLKHAAFGMTVFASHGMERTFLQSIVGTAELCLSYVLRD